LPVGNGADSSGHAGSWCKFGGKGSVIRSIFQLPPYRQRGRESLASEDRDRTSAAVGTEDTAAHFDSPGEHRAATEVAAAPDGLIPASQLPSAANILADLFSADRIPAEVARAADGAVSSEAVDTASRLSLAEEDRKRAAVAAILEPISEPPISAAVEPAPDPQPESALFVDPDIPTEPGQSAAAEPLFPDSESLPETELPPEIAASVEIAEHLVDEAARQELPVSSPILTALSQTPPPRSSAFAAPASNWAFEEKLAAHKEWLDSQGATGRKADFAEANVPGTDLINVNLRYADLQGANLKGADLLLADLRDSCLVRTNLEEACLVGANLEGANLEGATLDGAMGLLPRQLAGANLHDASLPDQIARFEARTLFARSSKTAMHFFTATMALSALSGVIIWRTRDLQLLTDSSIFPFLHTRAAAALPTAQIYLIAPVALFIVYLILQFHLQTLWDAALQLPAIFPNGAEIGQDSPRIIRALLRAHFRWMNKEAPSTRIIERGLGLVLAYWLAPVVLLLFWARFLTLQDLHGTALHTVLVAVAFGVALYSSTKIGRPQERWVHETKRSWQWPSKLRNVNPWKLAACMFVLLLFFSLGTVKGVPHSRSRAPQFSDASMRRWAPDVLWSVGFDPYANLTEAAISSAPSNWSGADSDLSRVSGARLNDTSFRYAQAYGVFLARAHLWHSNWEGAFLSDADFRGADLGQATLRFAVMDQARFYNASLDRADLNGANLDRADFRQANLSYSSLENAVLIDAQFQGASLYGAQLANASMQRANFERADLRSSYMSGANLEHADLRNAYLWSAKLPGADLENAQLGATILIDTDMRNADLRGAQFSGTVMTGANLSGAMIDGTDMRGALLLTASQVCSTKSRPGAILTDSLASQVREACGGPLLVAPATTSPTPAATQASSRPRTPTK
jgi:uncharacterized protein YjbI with pentapeptide repeats